MNWRLQSGLAGILAALGLYIMVNPVSVVGLAKGVIPWLLVGAGTIYIASIFLRSTRRPSLMITPAIIGVLLLYAGLSMKLGDGSSAGPVSLAFLLALLLFGSGAAKLLMAFTVRRSRYAPFLWGSGGISAVMGLVVLLNWQTVSASLIGVLLGLELLVDAAAMASLALRDRDGEQALEDAGLDPKAPPPPSPTA